MAILEKKGFGETYTPIVTPFDMRSSVCRSSVKNIIDRLNGWSKGIIPCLSTGEGWLLNDDQWKSMLAYCIEFAGSLRVIAGVLRSSTDDVIKLCRYAEAMNADGVIVGIPFGGIMSQKQIVDHYKAVHDSVGIELWVYHEENLCKKKASIQTLLKLAELPRVRAIKDSCKDNEILHSAKLFAEKGTVVYQGREEYMVSRQLPFGNIVSLSNLQPKLCYDAANSVLREKLQVKIDRCCREYGIMNADWFRYIKAELSRRSIIKTNLSMC